MMDRRDDGRVDRRTRPTPMISRYTFKGGRRRSLRRAGDTEVFYVDQFGMALTATLFTIFIFHALDALFTLNHLSRGGTEANPLMDFLIQKDSMLFVVVKLSVAALGLFFLGLHKNFPYVNGVIRAIFIIFAALLGYHFLLYFYA